MTPSFGADLELRIQFSGTVGCKKIEGVGVARLEGLENVAEPGLR